MLPKKITVILTFLISLKKEKLAHLLVEKASVLIKH